MRGDGRKAHFSRNVFPDRAIRERRSAMAPVGKTTADETAVIEAIGSLAPKFGPALDTTAVLEAYEQESGESVASGTVAADHFVAAVEAYKQMMHPVDVSTVPNRARYLVDSFTTFLRSHCPAGTPGRARARLTASYRTAAAELEAVARGSGLTARERLLLGQGARALGQMTERLEAFRDPERVQAAFASGAFELLADVADLFDDRKTAILGCGLVMVALAQAESFAFSAEYRKLIVQAKRFAREQWGYFFNGSSCTGKVPVIDESEPASPEVAAPDGEALEDAAAASLVRLLSAGEYALAQRLFHSLVDGGCVSFKIKGTTVFTVHAEGIITAAARLAEFHELTGFRLGVIERMLDCVNYLLIVSEGAAARLVPRSVGLHVELLADAIADLKGRERPPAKVIPLDDYLDLVRAKRGRGGGKGSGGTSGAAPGSSPGSPRTPGGKPPAAAAHDDALPSEAWFEETANDAGVQDATMSGASLAFGAAYFMPRPAGFLVH
jgi:hypothetical protein